jgi:hypothetical protein
MNYINDLFETNIQVEDDNYIEEALKGNFSANCLNKLFFSQDNIGALQVGMRNLVSKKSNGEHLIGKQDEVQLKLIMRNIYYEYGLNLDYNIIEQTQDLNDKVLKYAVDRILIEIEQHAKYIKDASTLYVPMERSVNLSNKGNKILYRDKLF